MAALLLAALLHVPLLIALALLLQWNQARALNQVEPGREFSLTVIEDDANAEKRAQKQKEEERKKLEKERTGQFISEAPPEVEETPDEARFLDQFASRADRETVRRDRSGPRVPTIPTPTPQPAQPERPPQTPKSAPAPQRAEDAPPTRPDEPSRPERPTPDDGTSLPEQAPDEDAALTFRQPGAQPTPSAAPTPQRPPGSDLFPNLHNTPAQIGGGGFDYLSDVEEGEKTLLNRKRSRYWSFMERLKEGVAREWNPVDEYRRRDPYGNVYGVKDRYTVVNMTLNSDGSMRTLYVAKSSGLDFYDREAVRALRAAAPFPNPPEGLKDQDGLIHINFGLLLDLSTGRVRSFRIQRQ